MSGTSEIAVVGAGISGLSTAFYLEKAARDLQLDLRVTLLEAGDRLGGVIRTEVEEGLLFEGGPEGWASYKPAGKVLAQEVGLGSELIGSRDEFRRTLVVRDGSLTALPDGMMFLAPVDPLAFWKSSPLSLLGKLRSSLEPLVSRSRGDLSVRRFFERRLGREFTEKLVEPLISAVYGSDFEQLSAPSSLPELHRAEQRAGSLWWGLRRFARMSTKVSVLATLKRGMQQLTDAIAANLVSTRILSGITGLELAVSGEQYLLRADGWEGLFDSIVLSTPAYAAGQILRNLSPEAAGILQGMPYGSSTLVYLVYDRAEFDHPLDGFGFIVPRREALLVDACTWVTTKFEYRCPADKVLLRCAIHQRNGRSTACELVAEQAADEVARVMGIGCLPLASKVFRVNGGTPSLLVGHGEKLGRLREELSHFPGLHVAGAFSGGVGVPDCIKTARETAAAVAARAAELAGG